MKFNNKQLNRCFYVFAKEIFQKICGAEFGIFWPLSLSSGMNLSNFIEISDVMICHNDDPEKRFVFNSLDYLKGSLPAFYVVNLYGMSAIVNH